MRLRYFGDRQDRWKWKALRDFFNEKKSTSLLYVGMISDLPWPSFSQDEDDLLLRELRVMQDEVLSVVEKRTSSALQSFIHENVTVVADGYRRSDRKNYFDKVKRLIQSQTPSVVFFDPDTGICPDSHGDDGHLMIDSLEVVLRSLRDHDSALIYQHRQRVEDNVADFALRRVKLAALCSGLELKREPKMIDSNGESQAYFIQL
jgi:hypothetical protein